MQGDTDPIPIVGPTPHLPFPVNIWVQGLALPVPCIMGLQGLRLLMFRDHLVSGQCARPDTPSPAFSEAHEDRKLSLCHITLKTAGCCPGRQNVSENPLGSWVAPAPEGSRMWKGIWLLVWTGCEDYREAVKWALRLTLGRSSGYVGTPDQSKGVLLSQESP